MWEVWEALGYIFLGGAIVGFFDYRAWRMYLQGRKDPYQRK